MEDKITVVFATRDRTEGTDNFLQMLQDTCGCSMDVNVLINKDGIGLSRLYHDTLETVETDIVVFIHDDITFLKKGWGKEIIRLFKENPDYGIIGVAGSAQFDNNGAWWNYRKRYGQVLHRHEGKSWLTAFSPLLEHDLEEVCVIDGLFMAVDKTRVKKNFDLNLEHFDFYDISFCLDNFLSKECKIGVTTNIRLAHNSVGELKPTWYEGRNYIKEKYKDAFPIDMPKEEKKKK